MQIASTALPSNHNPYYFTVTGVAEDVFEVMRFSSENFALNSDYIFSVEIRRRQNIELDNLLKQCCCLRWRNNNFGEIFYIHGVITEIIDRQKPGILYDKIILHSSLYPMNIIPHSRLYQNMDLQELITTLLENNGWLYKIDFDFALEKTYPKRLYISQYQESDFEFLLRQCSKWGINFVFQQLVNRAVLIFSDTNLLLSQRFKTMQLPFVSARNMEQAYESVCQLSQEVSLLTKNIWLNDYNPDTANTSLFVESQSNSTITGFGVDYRYNEHYLDINEGLFLLKIRQEALDCRREIFSAVTNSRSLQLGQQLVISHHPLEIFNGNFLIISVFLQASIINHENIDRVTIKIIRIYKPYRPKPILKNNMPDCLAKIISDHVDSNGCYFIQPLYDERENINSKLQIFPVRKVEHYAGNNYGWHFPLIKNTCVLISHINGDPDRPIIMGMYPDETNPNPVTAINKTQNIIRSPKGHQLVMDDMPNNQNILLQSFDQQNSLVMQAQQIALRAEQDSIDIQSGQSFSINSQGAIIKTIGQDHLITAENQYSINTQKGDINLQSGGELLLMANNNISFNINQAMLLKSQGDINFSAGQNLNFTVLKGNILLQINQGSFNLKANQTISISCENNLTIAIGASSICFSPLGITISANSVNFNCAQLISPPIQINSSTAVNSNKPTPQKNLQLQFFDDADRPMSEEMTPVAYVLTSQNGQQTIWAGGLQAELNHPNIDDSQEITISHPGLHVIAVDGQPQHPASAYLLKNNS